MQNPLSNTNLASAIGSNPQHKKTLIIGLVVFLSLAVILGAFYFIQKGKKTGPLSDQDRFDAISELQKSGAMKDSPITDKQRDEALKASAGSAPTNSSNTLTDEQRAEAINQLNLQ